jgi:hypothetical protein
VFVRILFILCHPEVIPKDLLVEDCQAKILTLWCFAPRVRKQSLRSECHFIIPSLRAKRGNLVFVRILFILCHPEVIPKDLLVEDCQAKILTLWCFAPRVRKQSLRSE